MRGMGPVERQLRRIWPFASLAVILLIIVVAVDASGGILMQRTVADGLIKLIVVVGIYIFMGNSGVLSFGSIVYMMIGAYAAAWLTLLPSLKRFTLPGLPDFLIAAQLDPLPALILAGLLAAAVSFVLALAIMRTNPIAISIATFAAMAMGYTIYNNWERVTLGTSSIIGLPMYVDMWVVFYWALVVLAIAYLYQISRLGLALRASREDEVAARAFGVNVYMQRVIAFTLSGFVVGIGGVLHGHFLGILTVNAFWIQLTFITLAMLVVGGQNSLAGAVVGVIVIITVTEVFRQLEKGAEIGSALIQMPLGLQEIILGGVMLAIMIFRPAGIMGGREIPWPFGPPKPARSVPPRALEAGAEKARTGD